MRREGAGLVCERSISIFPRSVGKNENFFEIFFATITLNVHNPLCWNEKKGAPNRRSPLWED